MGSEQLLIGNVAIASVIIKTLISTAKLIFPSLIEKVTLIRGLTVIFGVFAAFAVDVQLFQVVTENAWAMGAQKVIAGIFIAATAMGVHESLKSAPSLKR